MRNTALIFTMFSLQTTQVERGVMLPRGDRRLLRYYLTICFIYCGANRVISTIAGAFTTEMLS